MNTYVVPDGCPIRDDLLESGKIFFGSVITEKDLLVNPTRFDWTCAGCTVGIGLGEEPCPGRKCKMGGYPE